MHPPSLQSNTLYSPHRPPTMRPPHSPLAPCHPSPRSPILLKRSPPVLPRPKRIQMNRQPPRQRPHRNHIPDVGPHNRHRQKVHLRRLIRNLPLASPPRRPHRKPPMMRRRARLHLHPPQPAARIHNKVIPLVISIRPGDHQSPHRCRHHKLHLRQITAILRVIPNPPTTPPPTPQTHPTLPRPDPKRTYVSVHIKSPKKPRTIHSSCHSDT